ncbi:hypothetical protein BGZ73_007587 [Actinomortierella ambigua]|nr:hypothetical protein BGZ73_007587 [Actinomortierella ambigua]
MTPSPAFEKGHVEVGHTRDNKVPFKMYYEKTGNGPNKILLVMGLNTPGSAWEPVEYTTVTFDNRGVGSSDSPKGLYSTSQMAQDTIELLNHLGWKQDVHLVGVSMGGMISLELFLADPKRFRSLVLTSTNAGRSPPQFVTVSFLLRTILEKNADLRIKMVVDALYPKSWLDKSHVDFPDKQNREVCFEALVRRFAEVPRQSLHANISQSLAALFHHVSAKRLAEIKATGVPVLVLTGTDDNFVRPSGSYYLSKELDCPLLVFEGSGHALAVEHKYTYCRLLEEIVQNGNHGNFKI